MPDLTPLTFDASELEGSLASRFRKVLSAFPDHQAIVTERFKWTYRELDHRARRIARIVIENSGDGSEPVALLLDHDAPLIAALLGVLQAGKIYCSLDLTTPAARLAAILEDLSPSLLITDPKQLRLGEEIVKPGCDLVTWDASEVVDEVDIASVECLQGELLPGSARAAIFFTTGTTGKPKGVIRNHGLILHRVLFDVDELALCPDDRRTLLTSTSFPASMGDIMDTLLTGAALYPYPVKQYGANGLQAWLVEHAITIFRPPISLFRQYLNILADGDMAGSVRLIDLSGDVLYRTDIERARPHFQKSCKIRHHYATSEAGIIAHSFVGPEIESDGAIIPVGFPVSGKKVRLLDENLLPVAQGQVGEITIQSHYLSTEYWRQPELNLQKYRADPNKPDEPIYLTGDLGRFRPDGRLEFLGRKDLMVKIRGYNVDMSAIEAVLRELRLFKDVAVQARRNSTGEKQIVAYLVPDGKPMAAGELRQRLAQLLPDYMMPSFFVYLDVLPTGPNGKLDRQALPEPPRMRPDGIGEFSPPRNLLESLILDIWVEVLQLDGIGIYDSFLDLGGHSLLATQILARVAEVLQVELPQRTLFDAPTVAAMAEIAAQAIDTAETKTNGGVKQPIAPLEKSGPQPLSFAQERLWFLHQMEPEVTAYNETKVFKISGPLDLPRLNRSFQKVLKRQAALRTHFIEIDGQPYQVVADEPLFELPLIDLREAHDSAAGLAAGIAKLAHQPFDLEKDLLIRAKVFQLEDEEFYLAVANTLSSDNWSGRLLIEELAEIYSAEQRHVIPNLPELPVQYIDYALWQRQAISGETRQKLLDYWKAQLAGAPALELPTDYPRKPAMTYTGAKFVATLDHNLVQRLNKFNSREKATRFMTLAGVFYVLLMRYAVQEDICLGIPVANRTRQEIEKLIGCFVNTLVLRLDLAGSPTFRELLSRLRETALQAYDHQDLPFEALVEAIHPERNLQTNPLFQVLFNYRRLSSESFSLGNCSAVRIPFDSGLAKFDLSLEIAETSGGLVCEFGYNTDLFRTESIERMAGHYLTLLTSILVNPDEPVDTLPLLSENERETLEKWNQTDMELPPVSTMVELIEAQVRQTPDKVALYSSGQQLTYAELNRRANGLATRLKRTGLSGGQIVAIVLDRNPDMLVAILGVLKSGGAYLPIDPNFPAERIGFMLEDSRAGLVLTRPGLASNLPERFPGQILLVGEINGVDENPTVPIQSGDLAYVLYTSGSTGKPKGVAIEHHSALAFIAWAQSCFKPAQAAGVLASTSYCFDLSVFELLYPLTVGGAVILVENLFGLVNAPAASMVTLINTVPSLMMEYLADNNLPERTLVVNLAGEALPAALVERVFQARPDVRVFNLYGPTEATTYSTYAEIERGDQAPAIGRPIANTQAYILDQHRHPVPVGVPGDLYLGGAGLARGYLNRPELTEARFIQWSSAGSHTKRLYKTGDLARYRADGQIEYLGRSDQQVKLRGFRIELGEIEAALAEHPAVQQVAVMLRSDEPGESGLAAYIVKRHGSPTVSGAVLRQHLLGTLPDYMVPAVYIFLDTLPLTSNGKLDRNALPRSEQAHTAGLVAGAKLTTAVEQVIAGILSEVVGKAFSSGSDNFFELGGHSLAAIRATGKIREALRVELPVRAFMASPTVSGLAQAALSCSSDTAKTEKIAAILVQLAGITEEEAQDALDRITAG